MSALSFVALSLQTTHLDPATVSKASYVKLVDGNITRLDAIPVITPTSQSQTSPEEVEGQTSWGDALSQLSMMIGKLPIVSYYRDADKEIFQAASRKFGASLPPFHWLDCRALARELLPGLPEYQLSTVLKALDLYQDHADSTMVEQTAQIVLELAHRQGVPTVRELWGDLYNQPDELLGLEATLEGLARSEPTREESAEPATSPSINATAPAVPPVAVVPGLTQASAPDTQHARSQLPDEPGVETSDGAEHEIGAPPEETAQVVAPAEDEQKWPGKSQSLSEDCASGAESEEERITEGNGGSTTQTVLDDASIEQPEFLKVPLRDEPADVAFEHDSISKKHDDAVKTPLSEDAEDAVTANEPEEDEPMLIREGTNPADNGVAAQTEPLVEDAGESHPDSSSGSTARSVRESENHGEPEFLRVPLDDESHEVLDEEQTEATAAPDSVQPAESVSLPEPVEKETTSGGADLGDLTNESNAADFDEHSTTPITQEVHDNVSTELVDTPDPNHDATEQHVADGPAQAKPFQPVDQVLTPTTPPMTGANSPRSVATSQYAEVPGQDRTHDDGYGTSSSRSGRVLGLLGMIIFGVLTVVGLTLTVLATLLFFTTNNLLLETKIAGVVLTAAITLLSLLMTTLSYRSSRGR